MSKSNPDIKAKRSKRWKMEKPETAGIYWVRGFEWGNHLAMALVEVIKYRNKLICNLHQVNSEREKENWSLLSDLNENFEWLEINQ